MKKQMATSNESSSTHVTMGGSSLILIFVVFAMSVFALLAIRSSRSEYELAKKASAAQQFYYETEARVNEKMADILDLVGQMDSQTTPNKTEEMLQNQIEGIKVMSSDQDALVVSFSEEIQGIEGASLYVQFEVSLTDRSSYKILNYQYVPAKMSGYDMEITD